MDSQHHVLPSPQTRIPHPSERRNNRSQRQDRYRSRDQRQEVKGAIVVEPKPGVHFNVAVLDFASLYPSIIKVWNSGYETVRCPHQDDACRSNLIPGTPHWVCKRKRSLESLLIGSLRDLRVNRYKGLSKDRSLTPTLKNWYKVVSDATKVLLNASYGVFGAVIHVVLSTSRGGHSCYRTPRHHASNSEG